MSDRSWMLNPQAIRYAKECINIVKKELDIKLTLSHSDFIYLLHEYVDMLDSKELSIAYSKLISMAGPSLILKSLPARDENKNPTVIPMKSVVGSDVMPTGNNNDEMVKYHGREYAKWQDGKQFKGLYRGQPVYR